MCRSWIRGSGRDSYLLTELLNLLSHYLSFQAYSLLAGHFIGPSEPAFLFKLVFSYYV